MSEDICVQIFFDTIMNFYSASILFETAINDRLIELTKNDSILLMN